jgi:hypothetical protein
MCDEVTHTRPAGRASKGSATEAPPCEIPNPVTCLKHPQGHAAPIRDRNSVKAPSSPAARAAHPAKHQLGAPAHPPRPVEQCPDQDLDRDRVDGQTAVVPPDHWQGDQPLQGPRNTAGARSAPVVEGAAVGDFEDMGSSWVPVRNAVADGTLRQNNPEATDVAGRFEALLRFAALQLGTRLGTDVTVVHS